MSNPKIGMAFEDCRKRIRRISSTEKGDKELQGRLVTSLARQADLHQPGAGEALGLEMVRDFNNHSTPHLGHSTRYSDNYERIFRSKKFLPHPQKEVAGYWDYANVSAVS